MKRKKTGGRKAGVPNRDTKELRERIADLIDANFESIQADLDSLPPEKKLDVLVKLFEYALPKLNRTEIKADIAQTDAERTKPRTLDDWYDAQRSERYKMQDSIK